MAKHVAPKDWRLIIERAVTNTVQGLWWLSLIVVVCWYGWGGILLLWEHFGG